MRNFDSEEQMHITTVTKLGMNTNIAALTCYIPFFFVNIVSPAVWLVSEPKNNYFLRFHSTQAVVLGVTTVALGTVLWISSMILMFVPFIGHLLGGLLGLTGLLVSGGYFLTSFFLMYSGFNNRLVKLPVLGAVSDKVLTMIDNR